jgi:hypothetical protein
MPVTVVLAVGLDTWLRSAQSWLLSAQSVAWKSAGFVVISVASVKAAIDHFRVGDFDLVLLGRAFSVEIKERLTFLIKASGSRTPVISLSNARGGCDAFADATLGDDPGEFLHEMKKLAARGSNHTVGPTLAFSSAV